LDKGLLQSSEEQFTKRRKQL